MNQCWAFRNFYLRSFTGRLVDDVVRVKMYLPSWLWIYVHQNVWCYSPYILSTISTSGFSISFCNFKRLPSKDDEGMLSIWEILFNFIYMNVGRWSCADTGVCSIFHFKMCRPKYLLVLPTYVNNTPHLWVQYFIL